MDLGTMATKMGDWLAADTARLPTAVRYDIINLSMREICRDNDFGLNTTSKWFTLNAGAESFDVYDLPSGSLEFRGGTRSMEVYYYHSGGSIASRRFLTEVSFEELNNLYPDPTVSGDPVNFAVWGTNAFLRPVPSVNLVVWVDFSGIYGELTDPIATNPLMTFAWEPVFFLSLAKASKFLLEDARADLWEAEYRRTLQGVLRESKRVETSARRAVSQEPG